MVVVGGGGGGGSGRRRCSGRAIGGPKLARLDGRGGMTGGVTEGWTGGRGGQSVLGHVSSGPLIINSLVFLFLVGGFVVYWPSLA